MKKVLILIINFYQIFFFAVIKSVLGINRACRFSPTCSEYAKTTIGKKGVVAGLRKSAIRILRCQPFFSRPASGGSF